MHQNRSRPGVIKVTCVRADYITKNAPWIEGEVRDGRNIIKANTDSNVQLRLAKNIGLLKRRRYLDIFMILNRNISLYFYFTL